VHSIRFNIVRNKNNYSIYQQQQQQQQQQHHETLSTRTIQHRDVAGTNTASTKERLRCCTRRDTNVDDIQIIVTLFLVVIVIVIVIIIVGIISSLLEPTIVELEHG